MQRKRLTVDERLELIRLYRDEGWHIVHLARKYGIHHKSVQAWVEDVIRNVAPLTHCPQEIAEKSAQYSGRLNRPKFGYTYEEYLEQDERRREKKRLSCTHEHIAIICLDCGTHFEKTKTKPAAAQVIFM
jgi:transposase-like protein